MTRVLRSLTGHRSASHSRAAAILSLVGAAFVAATGSATAARAEAQSRPTAAKGSAPAGSVRVSVHRGSESDANRVVLFVQVASTGLALGSYQGELRFDASALVVDSAIAGRDGSRFVNATDKARGTIRFAGFTTSGFTGDDAVRIIAHGSRPLSLAQLAQGLSAKLDIAGDIDGRQLPKSALIASTGLAPQP